LMPYGRTGPVPVSMWAGCSRAPGLVSARIAAVTAPPSWLFRMDLDKVPSHAFLYFEMSDSSTVLCEAHAFEGWQVKDGRVIQEFATRRGCWAKLWRLPFDEERAYWKLVRCRGKVGTWTYSESQIARMLLWRRLRLPMRRSRNRVVCSEADSRILAPEINLPKYFNLKDHDYVMPIHQMLWCMKEGLEARDL